MSNVGDIYIYPSAPHADIVESDSAGTGLPGAVPSAAGAAGQSTVSMGMGATYSVTGTSNGVAAGTAVGGVRYVVTSTTPTGVAAMPMNNMQVIKQADYFTIYSSHPPYNAAAVLLAPEDGVGAPQGLSMTSNGVAGGTISLSATQRFVTTSNGIGSMTVAGTTTFAISSTSNGVGSHTAYLGSPWHIESTSVGVGGARDQFGTSGKWYLGSPHHITGTSAGVGHMTNYLSSRVYCAMTSAGVGHMTNYLSSPQQITSTSNGVGHATIYLSTPVPFAMTSAGQAASTMYLSSRIYITSTSAGRAACTSNYLSSRIYLTTTSHGVAGGAQYVGSRVYLTTTSHGVAGSNVYQGGTLHLPNTVMRGVGEMHLGPVLLNGYANGVGHMNNMHLAGTQRIATTSNGVGSMRENTILLTMVSHGSADGTEFDKPPFAFVVYAGCNFYTNSNWPESHGQDAARGVFMYLSSPLRLRNNDPNKHWINEQTGSFTAGTSQMDGRSSFTFPYEPRARADAGCNAFTGGRSDNHGPFVPQGVFIYQTGMVYMSATANSQASRWFNNGIPVVYAYMSSKVYFASTSHGASTVTFLRFGEFEANGEGGMFPTLGAPRRLLTDIHGIGNVTMYGSGRTPQAMTSHGIGGMSAYQHGNVHFGPGLITAHGIGTFFLDPGLMIAVSNGIGHMNDIERPSAVWMTWGRDGYYYVDPDNFPVSDPILMPRGSNGIAHMEIEIDGVPIMRQRIDGVAGGFITASHSVRQFSWTNYFAPTDNNPNTGPTQGGKGHMTATAFQPHDWQADGIGHMLSPLTLHYAFRTDPHGVGHMEVEGPKQLVIVGHGRASTIWHMTGMFAVPTLIQGVATVQMVLEGGTIFVVLYGDMLAQNFSISRPTHGQLWPRRFHLSGLPV